MIQLIIIALYFVIMIIVGIISRRSRWNADDFFVSGRRYTTFFITGSLLATIIGGSATVGVAGLGFSRGLTGMWWLLVGSLGLVVLGIFFSGKIRERGLYTLPELAEKQYGKVVAFAISVLVVISWLGVIAGQIIAAGKILSILGLGSASLWMIIFTVVFLTYLVIGGQDAVIRTDIIQIGVIIFGVFAGLGILIWNMGGFANLINALPSDKLAFPLSADFGIYELISYILLIGSLYAVGPDIYSRLFCARDTATVRKSALWTAVIIIPIAFAITMLGMSASVLFPEISPEQALPTIIKDAFNPVMSGIILATMVAAILPSATMMSATTILTVDIVGKLIHSKDEKRMISLSRINMIIVGLVSLALALVFSGVISALMFAYTIFTCGVIVPIVAGFYQDKLKVTSAGAMAAIIGGGISGLVSKIGGIQYLDLGSLAISLFLLFTVSFIENRLRARKKAENL
jgi:SSS family solute:Na+ symporter